MFSLPRLLRISAVVAPLALAGGLPCAAPAQTANVTTIHSFAGPTNGVSPQAPLVLGRDGNFYGTTQGGGPAEQGTVFVVTPAGRLTTLYSFNPPTGTANGGAANADGAVPTAGLIQAANGSFYGTTTGGGSYGYGTVFSITPSGTLTTLHSFNFDEGASPGTLLPAGDGGFYGVTQLGGDYSNGTVFLLSRDGTLTTLHHFTGEEGRRPQGALVQGDDGNLYGTLSEGGPYTGGAVFTITPAGVVTILHAFTQMDGAKPIAGLVRGRDGAFYGTTAQGGDANQGTVYRVTPAGETSILHSFIPYQDGASPNAALFQGGDGAFYGTTNSTAFKITADGQFTTLANLNGYSGGPDQIGSGLVAGTDGNFYGTLSYFYDGSNNNGGAVYTLTPAGVLTVLYRFDQRGNEGDSPRGLTQGSDGNFYGTTTQGGVAGWGTAYAMTPSGVLRTLHSFSIMDDGHSPGGALLQARDGKFYGLTSYGYGVDGTVFSLTPAGDFATFCRFHYNTDSGEDPSGALIQGSDGTFYGTAYGGGSSYQGTVFAVSPTGTITGLHTFTGSYLGSNSDGAEPYAGLTMGSDGKLYGVTTGGGTAGRGTVFVTTTAGAFQTLHSFTGNLSGGTGGTDDGASPYGELVQGSDGNFYGTTTEGGQYTHGTAFVVTPAGALKVLHSFGGSANEGTSPGAGLVLGDDGNFYGTTNVGGSYGQGTVFMMTPGGTVTTLYHFAGPDGARPISTLVRASDGSLYGAAYAGGLYNLGAIYRVTPGSTAPAATPAPDAQMGGAHPDSVTQGDNGDVFTLTVTNVGSAGTSGTVTVTVTPSQGLYLAAVSGPGWTCSRNGDAWTCTRTNALGTGHSYPALTVLVNVSPDAPTTGTGSLTSRVAVIGDMHADNDTYTDAFPIAATASTPTQRWRYRYFHTTANAGPAADDANPAGDGISNLLKYAVGLDPTTPAATAVAVDTITGYLRLTATKNADATDVNYTVQVSGDLTDPQGWSTVGTVTVQNTATLLQVRDATRVGSAGRRFIRLQVSR